MPLRADDEHQSDEEDVFEFELPGNRGLDKEKGLRKENGQEEQFGGDAIRIR